MISPVLDYLELGGREAALSERDKFMMATFTSTYDLREELGK